MSGGPPERASSFDRGVDAMTEVIRLGIRPFSAPREQSRTRRATDVVVLVPAALVLAFLVAAYPPSALELALIRTLSAFPRWLEPAWGFLEYVLGCGRRSSSRPASSRDGSPSRCRPLRVSPLP